jgi:hypothetical protein
MKGKPMEYEIRFIWCLIVSLVVFGIITISAI